MQITLHQLILDCGDGSAIVYLFSTPERLAAFKEKQPHEVLEEYTSVLQVSEDGQVSDPKEGSEYWTNSPGSRAIDPVAS